MCLSRWIWLTVHMGFNSQTGQHSTAWLNSAQFCFGSAVWKSLHHRLLCKTRPTRFLINNHVNKMATECEYVNFSTCKCCYALMAVTLTLMSGSGREILSHGEKTFHNIYNIQTLPQSSDAALFARTNLGPSLWCEDCLPYCADTFSLCVTVLLPSFSEAANRSKTYWDEAVYVLCLTFVSVCIKYIIYYFKHDHVVS